MGHISPPQLRVSWILMLLLLGCGWLKDAVGLPKQALSQLRSHHTNSYAHIIKKFNSEKVLVFFFKCCDLQQAWVQGAAQRLEGEGGGLP